MNNQKPEPRAKIGDGSVLDVHSIFFTIQGEGPFTGHRSIFVRLAGCNLQCPGCDTEYTQGRSLWSVSQLTEYVTALASTRNAPGCLIVITGGEPLRQDLDAFVRNLVNAGHNVQIESNGVFEISPLIECLSMGPRLCLVVSPKTKRINERTARRANAFKYVLRAGSVDADDGLPILALDHPAAGGVARPHESWNGPVYVNPFDEKDDKKNRENLQAAAVTCAKFGYILGVQLHKLVGLE